MRTLAARRIRSRMCVVFTPRRDSPNHRSKIRNRIRNESNNRDAMKAANDSRSSNKLVMDVSCQAGKKTLKNFRAKGPRKGMRSMRTCSVSL